MHIDSSTHEHSISGKVYTYEGDYEVSNDAIDWQAVVSHVETPLRELTGSIPLSSPAIASVGEQAVRDAIVKKIDGFDDRVPARPS